MLRARGGEDEAAGVAVGVAAPGSRLASGLAAAGEGLACSTREETLAMAPDGLRSLNLLGGT
jgi:hypothetical protein